MKKIMKKSFICLFISSVLFGCGGDGGSKAPAESLPTAPCEEGVDCVEDDMQLEINSPTELGFLASSEMHVDEVNAIGFEWKEHDKDDVLTWKVNTDAKFISFNSDNQTVVIEPSWGDIGTFTYQVEVSDGLHIVQSNEATVRVSIPDTPAQPDTPEDELPDIGQDLTDPISIRLHETAAVMGIKPDSSEWCALEAAVSMCEVDASNPDDIVFSKKIIGGVSRYHVNTGNHKYMIPTGEGVNAVGSVYLAYHRDEPNDHSDYTTNYDPSNLWVRKVADHKPVSDWNNTHEWSLSNKSGYGLSSGEFAEAILYKNADVQVLHNSQSQYCKGVDELTQYMLNKQQMNDFDWREDLAPRLNWSVATIERYQYCDNHKCQLNNGQYGAVVEIECPNDGNVGVYFYDNAIASNSPNDFGLNVQFKTNIPQDTIFNWDSEEKPTITAYFEGDAVGVLHPSFRMWELGSNNCNTTMVSTDEGREGVAAFYIHFDKKTLEMFNSYQDLDLVFEWKGKNEITGEIVDHSDSYFFQIDYYAPLMAELAKSANQVEK